MDIHMNQEAHSPNDPIQIETYKVQSSKHTLDCVSGGGILTATCLYIERNQYGKEIRSNSQNHLCRALTGISHTCLNLQYETKHQCMCDVLLQDHHDICIQGQPEVLLSSVDKLCRSQKGIHPPENKKSKVTSGNIQI